MKRALNKCQKILIGEKKTFVYITKAYLGHLQSGFLLLLLLRGCCNQPKTSNREKTDRTRDGTGSVNRNTRMNIDERAATKRSVFQKLSFAQDSFWSLLYFSGSLVLVLILIHLSRLN